MAKLKAPLMSLGASGQVGKALVFFPWKGINAVREHVVPANPKTTGQNTQRGYMTAAVALIHACQALPVNPLDAEDITAYALKGSTHPTPRTWFNEAVKGCVDQNVAGKTGGICCNGTTVEAADELDPSIYGVYINDPTAGDFWYGTSKTALVNKKAATVAANHYSADITGLTTGVKYYWQFRPTAPAAAVGCNSGIYYGTPL